MAPLVNTGLRQMEITPDTPILNFLSVSFVSILVGISAVIVVLTDQSQP